MTSTTPESSVIAHREIWESTVEGRTSMEVINPETGRPQNITARGKGQRLRITTEQRQIIEEGIRKPEHNPFRNGCLTWVNRPTGDGVVLEKHQEPSPDELDDDTLAILFETEGEDFKVAVASLSELNVRRLKTLSVERDAKVSQIAFINEYLEEHFAIGGDTPTYREMQAVPDSAV